MKTEEIKEEVECAHKTAQRREREGGKNNFYFVSFSRHIKAWKFEQWHGIKSKLQHDDRDDIGVRTTSAVCFEGLSLLHSSTLSASICVSLHTIIAAAAAAVWWLKTRLVDTSRAGLGGRSHVVVFLCFYSFFFGCLWWLTSGWIHSKRSRRARVNTQQIVSKFNYNTICVIISHFLSLPCWWGPTGTHQT